MNLNFGENVKNRRRELGLTQIELAELTRTTQPYISRVEKGAFNPSMIMILKIAKALRTSTDRLLGVDKKRGAEFGE